MGFRSVSQRLCGINLQVLGKFPRLTLVLDLESASHPAGPVQAPSFGQGTASPSLAILFDPEDPVRAKAEMWNVGLSDVVSVRDELRWVF